MGTPLLLIALMVFMTVLLGCAAAVSFAGSVTERRKVMDRVKDVATGATDSRLGTGDDRPSAKEQAIRLFTALGKKVKPDSARPISALRTVFLRAGYHHRNAAYIYYGAKTLCAAVFPALVVVLKVAAAKPVPITFLTALCVMAALFGFYLPNLWLQQKSASRRAKIVEGFPDALDLMVVCVEAGMGIDAVVHRVGSEMQSRNSVVSEEFHYLSLELRAGKSRAEALRNLALRADLEDVSSLVTLLIQTDKFGTSVAQALRVHASSMRTRRRQRAEEMAAKLPVKLVFPLVCFIFPALFVVIAGPAFIRIVRAFAGLG